MRTALIIVDVQNDFLPGGALAVPNGDEVIAPLVEAAKVADLIIATRDWHPADHSSFNTQGGQWPPHCVQNTRGAMLAEDIARLANYIVDKGVEVEGNGYSAFEANIGKYTLEEFLKGQEVDRLLIGGLATDYCVGATVFDAQRFGFNVELVEAGCRGIDPDVSQGVISEFGWWQGDY